MDNARALLQRFAQVFPQEENHSLAYTRTRTELPHFHDEVLARSLNVGHVPPIAVGEEFRYRNQLKLAGLHNDYVRGICYNRATEVATVVVIKYPLHNFDDGNVGYYVGGEGGEIAEANNLGMRVLEHQRMSAGNRSMDNTHLSGNPVRLMVYEEIQPGGNNVGHNPNNMGYVYRGLYIVHQLLEQVTPEGFVVYEYVLHPQPINVVESIAKTKVKICCIGAGYVGRPTMAVIALNCPRVEVVVVDTSVSRITVWNSEQLPIKEAAGLHKVVKHSIGKNRFFGVDVERHVSETDIISVSVNTPTKTQGLGARKAVSVSNFVKSRVSC